MTVFQSLYKLLTIQNGILKKNVNNQSDIYSATYIFQCSIICHALFLYKIHGKSRYVFFLLIKKATTNLELLISCRLCSKQLKGEKTNHRVKLELKKCFSSKKIDLVQQKQNIYIYNSMYTSSVALQGSSNFDFSVKSISRRFSDKFFISPVVNSIAQVGVVEAAENPNLHRWNRQKFRVHCEVGW